MQVIRLIVRKLSSYLHRKLLGVYFNNLFTSDGKKSGILFELVRSQIVGELASVLSSQ